jgi:hypothetical protein
MSKHLIFAFQSALYAEMEPEGTLESSLFALWLHTRRFSVSLHPAALSFEYHDRSSL